MSSFDAAGKVPQDIVAIFHTSFHPTKGNVVDWHIKASSDLNLDGLEFNTLPSGLHLVEQDVVYFTRDNHAGVSVFRRRKTNEHGHRGFRLSALGILLVKSTRSRPWRHVAALCALVDTIYSSLEDRRVLDPSENDWAPAQAFFEERKVRRSDLGGAGDWHGWSHELDCSDIDAEDSNPTFHLPHLLRILGPSALTLYKYAIGRQRILIYTLPPVEAACILCQVSADICYEAQVDTLGTAAEDRESVLGKRLKGKSREGINVLGVVTLNDLGRMYQEGKTGRGWIACTTDAILLEKSCCDLVIDLTTLTPSKSSRPTFYVPNSGSQPSGSGGFKNNLSVVRFTWSDVRLWNELDRLLQLDGMDQCARGCCSPSPEFETKSKSVSSWVDAWRLYEDVCVVCAGLWMGTWRSNSTMSYSNGNGSMVNWGSVRLEGSDDLTVGGTYMRNVGMGIEGGPGGSVGNASGKGLRRSSGISWSAGAATPPRMGRRQASGSSGLSSSSAQPGLVVSDSSIDERQERQMLTTLALLQTFHMNTCFHLSRLASFLPPSDDVPTGTASADSGAIISITPRDMMSFDLGPFSALDARYLEWLAAEYAGMHRIVIRRGWKDLIGVVFGFG